VWVLEVVVEVVYAEQHQVGDQEVVVEVEARRHTDFYDLLLYHLQLTL
jgi:hypothetical protein